MTAPKMRASDIHSANRSREIRNQQVTCSSHVAGSKFLRQFSFLKRATFSNCVRGHTYDDQLTRIVVDYDPDQTAGMTDADLTEAISSLDRQKKEAAAAQVLLEQVRLANKPTFRP
jgi:hypothetical protein